MIRLFSDRKNTSSHYRITVKQGLAYFFLVMFNILMLVFVNFLVMFIKFWSYSFGHINLVMWVFLSNFNKLQHTTFDVILFNWKLKLSLRAYNKQINNATQSASSTTIKQSNLFNSKWKLEKGYNLDLKHSAWLQCLICV